MCITTVMRNSMPIINLLRNGRYRKRRKRKSGNGGVLVSFPPPGAPANILNYETCLLGEAAPRGALSDLALKFRVVKISTRSSVFALLRSTQANTHLRQKYYECFMKERLTVGTAKRGKLTQTNIPKIFDFGFTAACVNA